MDRLRNRPARRSRTVGLFFALLLPLAVSVQCGAQGPLLVPPREHPDGVPEIEDPIPEWNPEAGAETSSPDRYTWARLMRELSEEVIPPQYEVRKDWGDTTEVFAGFNVQSNNGLPRISKRTRRVNHGLWRRFHVQLVRPEERFKIELRNARLLETGGLAGEIVVTARLRCRAEAVSWSYGVRGPDTIVLSDLTLRAVSDWRLSLRDQDPDAWIPEYRIVPEVRRVRLRILDLDVRRVGLIGGELADALGDASREVVEELLERQEPRVLRRLQRETGQLD